MYVPNSKVVGNGVSVETWIPWTNFDPWNYNSIGKLEYRRIHIASTEANTTLQVGDSYFSPYGTMAFFGAEYPLVMYVDVFGQMGLYASNTKIWYRYFNTGSGVPWTSLTGVPGSFPPSGHQHAWSDIVGGPSLSLSGTTLTITC